MAFSVKRPSHVFSLLFLLIIFLILYVPPLLIKPSKVERIAASEDLLIMNTLLTTFLLLLPVILWLHFVDNMKMRDMVRYLRLNREGFSTAFAYGILCFLFIFFLHIATILVLQSLHINVKNPVAQKIAMSLSPVSMIFISVVQSTGEEVFFRGFLLRKIQEKSSGLAAILITAILFGLAHLSYGTWYQLLMPTFIGLVFGYIVIKTNNLYSSITSHITLNLVMFLIAYALKSLIL